MKYILFILLSISLHSCFDIIEEINFNKDGSGTFTYKINLGKYKFTLDNIIKLDSIGKYKIPSQNEIQADLNKLQSQLNSIEGVSDVKCTADFDYYIFKVSGAFKNVHALNKVYTSIYNFKRKEKLPLIEAYGFKNNVFERKEKDPKTNIFVRNTFLKENQFTEGKIMIITRFVNEVASVSNVATKISKNGKAVLTKCTAAQLMKKPSTINCQVKLK